MNSENITNEELIRNYLADSLSPSVKEGFEDKLLKDPNLQREFDFYRRMVEVKANESRYEILARLQKLRDTKILTPDYSWTKPRFARLSALILASGILLVVGVLWYFSSAAVGESPRVADELYFPLENMINYPPGDSDLARGLEAYDLNEYATAAHFLRQVPAGEIQEIQLYLGVSYLLSDSPDSAAAILEPLVLDSILRVSATYYLGLAQLQRDSPEIARRTLSPLLEHPNYGPLLRKSKIFAD
jgi:hypothetical protein